MTVGQIQEWVRRHVWARWAGSGLLLIAALALLPRHRLEAALERTDAHMLVWVLPLFLTIHALSAVKWHLLVSRAGAGISPRSSAEAYFAGLFGTLFLPTLGGDAVAVALGSTQAERPAGVVAGAVLSRGLDTVALAILVSAAAVTVPDALNGEGARLLRVVMTGAAGMAVAAGALLLLVRPSRRPRWLDRLLAYDADALTPLLHPSLIAAPLVISVIVQASFALLALPIARSCGIAVGLGPWMFAWQLAKLVAFVPLTIAGIGARELALAAVLAPFGVPTGPAIALGLAWDVVAITGSLASGVAWKLASWLRSPRERGTRAGGRGQGL